MKSKFYCIILSVISVQVCKVSCGQVQENPVKTSVTVNLNRSRLVSYGYSGSYAGSDDDKKKQPIRSRADAINFVDKIQKNENLGVLSTLVANIFSDISLSDNSDYTLILFRHPLNLKKLFEGDTGNLRKAREDYHDACTKRQSVINLLKLADEKFRIKDSIYRNGGTNYIVNNLSAPELAEMNNLSTFRSNLLSDKTTLENIMRESRKLYKQSLIEIVEEDKVESYVLNKEKDDWSDYLLNKKNVLLVFIGGANDFAKSTVIINNKPASYKTDLDQLAQLAAGLGVKAMDAGDETACAITDKGLQELPVTFMLLKPSKIQPPSDLIVAFADRKDTSRFQIHEKTRFGVKVGFSASLVDRKNFTVENNLLTIKTDSAKKEELKSNLIALFEWIPWGRDIDRMEPVWKKDKSVGTFSIDRFGFVGGVKISKDPLQTILLGGSYSFSREAALNFGIAFYATPKNVSNLKIGTDASLDFLKENADRELVPKIFVGLSFSPGQVGKSLGILK